MEQKLAGKRALVTGSNTGIGKAIAQSLARSGASVIVHGRDRDRTFAVAESIRREVGTADAVIGDLASEEGAQAVIGAVGEITASIDILVNNAGGIEPATSWFDLRPEQWGAALQQNLIAAVRMIHAFVPAMRGRGWGRVVNIASGGGSQPLPNVAAYCAAKAAMINMTVSLSKELARSGVTVNSVSPGPTRTEMFEGAIDRMAQQRGWPEGYAEREARFMDLGIYPCASSRYGEPEEIAALVALLASPSSAFFNGANYRVDGGQCQSIN